MVLSAMPNLFASSRPWGIPSAKSPPCGFVCHRRPRPSVAAALPPAAAASKLRGAATEQGPSAEWIDLLSPGSYPSSPSIPLPGRIDPPRSGGVSASTSAGDRLVAFAGYAEVVPAAPGGAASPERFVVNDLWTFDPYRDAASSWGWTKVPRSDEGYVPGPRLATALAVFPSSENENAQAVLLGGWDPQTPGTGGVILDDVSTLDLESLKWRQCSDATNAEDACSVPGGPTSRHVAVPLSIKHPDREEIQRFICLHNHRCEDHVLLLSTTSADEGSNKTCAKWERQPTTGDVPSSRGLHCAAPLMNAHDENNTSKAMVTFGGAAKDGIMSNEAFVLDVNTWRWTKLDCGSGDDVPSPRAGACMCPLDENSVLLFGGAMPCDGGLLGLNDVWVLHIDMERGEGKWRCLLRNQDSDCDEDGDGAVFPPGRNAATLSAIDPDQLLPKDLKWTKPEGNGGEKYAHFLLQGGWYPFRETYNDAFLLRISMKN